MAPPSLSVEGEGESTVPPPLPPDDPEAWYAPTVRDQREVHPGVVVTISESASTGARFRYGVREPSLSRADERALAAVEDHFAAAGVDPPRTREATAERMAAGFRGKYRTAVDRLTDCTPAGRRRVDYHALARVRCLGDLTPHALDERIDVADADGDSLVVHTADYAPAVTALPADHDHLGRFASERLSRRTVSFHGFEIPVVLYRERLLGADPFDTKYAVEEPDLLPGDAELVEAVKARVWATSVDGLVEDRVAFVRDRAETLLARQLTARNTRAWLDAVSYRMRTAAAELGLAAPPVDRRFADDRLSDLVYYILRDFVGHGQLTIPVRDPMLEDVEANRVGERVKVVPRGRVDEGGRIPTNLTFEDEQAFVNVVTQLAADDGVELNASNPTAKVNLAPEGVEETIRCAVALPTVSEDGPHISIRKQAADVLTPVDLVESGSVSTELVALLWLLYEAQGVVLFSGPTGVGKTTLMNAHMPFIDFSARPISIDEGSREVRLPHETGVSLTTRDHESEFKRVTMADLMTEANYLNPDVEVIAEINTPESFETFAQVLQTGHGVIGTTHAEDVRTLVNRVVEQGLPAYLLRELDLVVFPRHVDGERYVGEVVELLDERAFESLDRPADKAGVVHKDGTDIYWNVVASRDHDGEFDLAYAHPELGDEARRVETMVFDRLAGLQDRSVEAVESSFHRKHRYVRYLVKEGIADFEDLFGFLADLRVDEAATVERATRQQRRAPTEGQGDD